MSDVHTVQRAIEGLPSIADMPAEIRFQIYDLMNAPRFVELRYDELLTTFWTPTMVPVGLQVCRESRRETQSHYVKRFAGRDGEANIWFDFSYDTLYFSMYSLLVPSVKSMKGAAIFFEADEGKEVRHLAIHAEVMDIMADDLAEELESPEVRAGDTWAAHLAVLPDFRKLDTLTVVGDLDTEFKLEMYNILCERAKEEEMMLGWSTPRIRFAIEALQGYVIEEIQDNVGANLAPYPTNNNIFGPTNNIFDTTTNTAAGPSTNNATDSAVGAVVESDAESDVEPVVELVAEASNAGDDNANPEQKGLAFVAAVDMIENIEDIDNLGAALEATSLGA